MTLVRLSGLMVAMLACLAHAAAQAEPVPWPSADTPLTDADLIDDLDDVASIEHMLQHMEHVFRSELLDAVTDPALYSQLSQILDIDQLGNFELQAVELGVVAQSRTG